MLATRVLSNTLHGYTCWFWTFAFTVVVLFRSPATYLWRGVCWAAVEVERSRRCDAGVSCEAAEARVRSPTLPLLFPKLCPPNIARVGGRESYSTGGNGWHLPRSRKYWRNIGPVHAAISGAGKTFKLVLHLGQLLLYLNFSKSGRLFLWLQLTRLQRFWALFLLSSVIPIPINLEL